MGQNGNEHWFEYQKCSITATKAHEVVTQMTKEEKAGGGAINMWSLNQKIFVFAKPNIRSLKNDTDIQIEAAKTFIEFIEGKHKDIKLSKCGLFVDEAFPYVGASPDRIFL